MVASMLAMNWDKKVDVSGQKRSFVTFDIAESC